MSTASIVAISAILVLLLTFIVASAITLVIVILRLQRAAEVFKRSLDETLSTIMDRNIEHREALVQSLTSHSHNLQLLSQSISATLESHYAKIEAQVASINGKALIEAITEFKDLVRYQSQAATRTERAALAIGELAKALISEEAFSGAALDRAKESGLTPDSYAPSAPGERYTSRSRTAAGDVEDLAEEAADNSIIDQ